MFALAAWLIESIRGSKEAELECFLCGWILGSEPHCPVCANYQTCPTESPLVSSNGTLRQLAKCVLNPRRRN